MKKICLLTINDNNNYGNRLQNYASFIYLSRIGYKVYNMENYTVFNRKKRYLLKRFKYRKYNRLFSDNNDKKKKFELFNEKIRYYDSMYNPFKKYDDFDYVVVGSDQVWHPKFALDDATSLKYFPPRKRVSLAASFGVESVDEKSKEIIKKEIGRFKAISVREEAGKKMIKSITGRDAEVLVDPTMLLDKEEWLKVSTRPEKMIHGPFVLTYFLSPMSDSTGKLLEEFSKSRNVIRLLDENDESAKSAGPSEFLYYFEHADLILTDSFHACVFSFLFDKPFLVFDRNIGGQSMNSRIENLLTKFKLERKYINSGFENDVWEHNYKDGYRILEDERKKVYKYIKDSLGD